MWMKCLKELMPKLSMKMLWSSVTMLSRNAPPLRILGRKLLPRHLPTRGQLSAYHLVPLFFTRNH